MDTRTIFAKTSKGLKELEKVGKNRSLSSEFRRILKEIDAQTPAEKILVKLGDLTEDQLLLMLEKLVAREYIRTLVVNFDDRRMLIKTAKGLKESVGNSHRLPSEPRKILKEIDGKTSLAQLQAKFGNIDKATLLNCVNRLLASDYIRESTVGSGAVLNGVPGDLGDLIPLDANPESIWRTADDYDLGFSSIMRAEEPDSKPDAITQAVHANALTDELAASQDQQRAAAERATARRAVADELVNSYVPLVAGVSLVPIPALDLVLIASIQLRMLSRLSALYGIPFNEKAAKSCIGSLSAIVMQGTLTMGLVSALKVVPGLGPLVGATALPAMGAACTYAMGQVFITHFEDGGTLQNFDPANKQASFRSEFERARK